MVGMVMSVRHISTAACKNYKAVCPKQIKETSRNVNWKQKQSKLLGFTLYTEYFEAQFT